MADSPTRLPAVRIALVGAGAATVGALTSWYGTYFVANPEAVRELKILGAWLLAVVGLGVVVLAQLATGRPVATHSQGQPHPDVPGWRSQVVRPAAALLSGGAALIHFGVIGEHFEEFWLFGAFFVGLSIFQMAWALWVAAAPGRWLLVAGLAVNAFTVAVWVLSRWVGLPLGPEAGEPITPGFGDSVTTVFEALIVVACVLLLPRRREVAGMRLAAATATTAVLALLVLAITAFGLISAVGGSEFVPEAG